MGWISQNSSQVRKPDRLLLLLYGPPKTGKTTLACSGERVLLIEYDPEGENTEPLLGRKDIHVARAPTRIEFPKLVADPDIRKFRWIVVDTVTSWQDAWLSKPLDNALNTGKDTRPIYRKAGITIAKHIQELSLLPANLVVTAQLKTYDAVPDSPAQMWQYGPDITPMLRKTVEPMANLIGRTEKKVANNKPVYKVLFRDLQGPCGGRVPVHPEYTDLNLDKLVAEIGA